MIARRKKGLPLKSQKTRNRSTGNPTWIGRINRVKRFCATGKRFAANARIKEKIGLMGQMGCIGERVFVKIAVFNKNRSFQRGKPVGDDSVADGKIAFDKPVWDDSFISKN